MKVKEKIKVGPKAAEEYVAAVLVGFEISPQVILEGMGRQKSKVLEIAQTVVNLARAKIINIEAFTLNDVHGLSVILERASSEVERDG
jgi:DNA-binding protein